MGSSTIAVLDSAHDRIGNEVSTFPDHVRAKSRILSRPGVLLSSISLAEIRARFPRISPWQRYRREVSTKRSAQRSNFTGEIAAGASSIAARLR
jgi:hypothetical protein